MRLQLDYFCPEDGTWSEPLLSSADRYQEPSRKGACSLTSTCLFSCLLGSRVWHRDCFPDRRCRLETWRRERNQQLPLLPSLKLPDSLRLSCHWRRSFFLFLHPPLIPLPT